LQHRQLASEPFADPASGTRVNRVSALRGRRFAAASRIRKNPDFAARLRSFACNLIRADGGANVRSTRWRAALDLDFVLKMPQLT
jgi:hypothetical protein